MKMKRKGYPPDITGSNAGADMSGGRQINEQRNAHSPVQ